MDLFQLLDRRQPPPRQGHGLPEAWVHWCFFLLKVFFFLLDHIGGWLREPAQFYGDYNLDVFCLR